MKSVLAFSNIVGGMSHIGVDHDISFESLVSFEQDLTFNAAEKVFAEAGVDFGRNQMATLGFFSGESYTNLAFPISDQCTAG